MPENMHDERSIHNTVTYAVASSCQKLSFLSKCFIVCSAFICAAYYTVIAYCIACAAKDVPLTSSLVKLIHYKVPFVCMYRVQCISVYREDGAICIYSTVYICIQKRWCLAKLYHFYFKWPHGQCSGKTGRYVHHHYWGANGGEELLY